MPGHTFGVRVDGAAPRGFSGFLSLTALWAEGCGIALTGDEHKVSVTGFTFSIIRYDKHYGNQPPPVAFSPFGALRHQRGNVFPTPTGRLYGFPTGESPIVKVLYKLAPYII